MALLLGLSGWLIASSTLIVLGLVEAARSRDALADLRDAATVDGFRDRTFDASVASAHDSLRRADGFLSNPILRPLHHLPILGRQLDSISAMAGAGEEITDVGQVLLRDVRALEETMDSDRSAGLVQLARSSRDALTRLQSVDLGPERALFAPLDEMSAKARVELDDATSMLRRTSSAAAAVATLFEKDGRYLVLAANNGEMRSGAGMFLSAGELETGGGSIRLDEMRTVGAVDVPEGSIAWPEELAGLWGWLGHQDDLRNLMVSPRFDASAPIAAEIWTRSGRPQVDGVMVIDVELLHALVVAIGPLQIDDTQITAADVREELLVDQYRRLDGTTGAQLERRELLSRIAGAAFSELDSGEWDPIVLGRQLARAADGRHLMVWSRQPIIDALWDEAGVGGRLTEDSLALNIVNVGGNKLDQFLRVKASLAAVRNQRAAESRITVEIENTTPPSAPRYVAGPFSGSGLERGEYQGMLTFALPGDSTGARFESDLQTPVVGRDGPTVAISTPVRIRAGETKTFVLRFERPRGALRISIEPSARIPSVEWRHDGARWFDDRRRVLLL